MGRFTSLSTDGRRVPWQASGRQLLVAIALAGLLSIGGAGFGRDLVRPAVARADSPITHVVVIDMENHSFDSLFGTFPGANGIIEPRASDPLRSDYDHTGPATLAALDGGAGSGLVSRPILGSWSRSTRRRWHDLPARRLDGRAGLRVPVLR